MTTYTEQLRRDALARVVSRLDAEWDGAPDASWLQDYRDVLALRDSGRAPAEGPLAGLARAHALVLVTAGLIEDDIRFGAAFAALQAPLASRRPCIGLVSWLLADGELPDEVLTMAAHDLVRRGVLTVENPTDPRAEWVLSVPVVVWDLVESGAINTGGLPPQLHLRRDFPPLEEVVVGPRVQAVVTRLPDLVADGSLTAVVVRGMSGSGRTTLLGAVAQRVGLEVLLYDGDPADPAWQLFGALASLADVLPVVACDPGPGETVTLPSLPGVERTLGLTCGRSGGLDGAPMERAITVLLEACGRDDRRVLWSGAGLVASDDDAEEIVERFLLTPGDIVRVAPLVRLEARSDGRLEVRPGDVRAATRTLRRQELETLATMLEPLPAGATPVLGPAAAEEFLTLVLRCRHRERLVEDSVQPTVNRGVRALFTGPSGTGKTLAARHLAALLNLDLYRVDLAAVVNKYIGETERNLDKVLGRAEELDVLLLLDEGDALMTRRTDVANANDRYANLETNFLLQRLETFDGIVVVTSNAAGRIDPAFLRRIDVTVDFVPPDAEQRWQIWSAHLPLDHEVDPEVLAAVANRCVLTGGQIRNAALHATLLAIDRGESTTGHDLVTAVRREYRRAGATCPLPGQRSPEVVARTNSVPSW